ncbi:MAG: hypothetical protein Q9174_002454 [Haloplaca sp. 1 TL-2023]
MKIMVATLTGREIELEMQASQPTFDVKVELSASSRLNCKPSHINLLYGGKIMTDSLPLEYYNITAGSTLHLVWTRSRPENADLPAHDRAKTSHEACLAAAKNGGFDPDFHIVDPQSHFDLLQRLEEDVFKRSGYYQHRSKHPSHASLSFDLTSEDEAVFSNDNPEHWKMHTNIKNNITRYNIVGLSFS